jgi:hypothetical protein
MNSATSTPSLFRGGGGQYCMGKVRGGSRGGNDNPPKYYYEQNKYENDPQHQQIASRQLPNKVGGKKNKTRKMMSGGSGLHMTALSGAYGTVATYNPLYSVGDTGTSNIPAHILSGNINSNILPNPSTLQQPTNSKYNQHNRPMA